MPIPCKLHELAYEEYIQAYEWYELKQKGLGDRFMFYVEKRLSQICEHPEYYGKRNTSYREAKVENFPYMIVYKYYEDKQFILISAIYHGKRDPKGRYRRTK